MTQSAIVLFAHGSRDDSWAKPLKLIRDSVIAIDKEALVGLAFLESMRPTLGELISELSQKGVNRVTLIPLFVASGTHLKCDLASLLAEIGKNYPDISITLAPSLGDSEDMRESIAGWVYRTHRNACRK